MGVRKGGEGRREGVCGWVLFLAARKQSLAPSVPILMYIIKQQPPPFPFLSLSIITTYLHKPDPAASIWTANLLLRYLFTSLLRMIRREFSKHQIQASHSYILPQCEVKTYSNHLWLVMLPFQ